MQTGIFKDLIAEESRLAVAEHAAATQVERRYLDAGLTFPPDWLVSGYSGLHTEAGITITPVTAFQVNTFLTCVDLISSGIASLPAHIYQRSFNEHNRPSHEIAYKHRNYELVHAEPNEEMSHHTFLKTFMVHALAWSNAFAEIQRDSGGNIVAIWPRNPSATRPRRYATPIRLEANAWRPYAVNVPAYALLFETSDPIDNYDFAEFSPLKNGVGRLILADDMLHVPGLSFDGRLGTSTTWLAREVLAQTLAMVKYSSKYFANYAQPHGILEIPTINQEDRNKVKQEWMSGQGGRNQNGVAVLPTGSKFTPMSNNPKDSQATEALQHVRTEIAAIFHVPARMVGDNSHASRGTTEQENQEYLSYTLSPWLNAIKQEWKRKLFPHPGIGTRPKNPYYVDFDTADLLRADSQSRIAFYSSGSTYGYLSANDIRVMEKLNPIDDERAEDYYRPVNTAPVDVIDDKAQVLPANTQLEGAQGENDSEEQDGK